MKVASKHQVEYFTNKANDWADDKSGSSWRFDSSKHMAKLAYAEALANAEGYTIFKEEVCHKN